MIIQIQPEDKTWGLNKPMFEMIITINIKYKRFKHFFFSYQSWQSSLTKNEWNFFLFILCHYHSSLWGKLLAHMHSLKKRSHLLALNTGSMFLPHFICDHPNASIDIHQNVKYEKLSTSIIHSGVRGLNQGRGGGCASIQSGQNQAPLKPTTVKNDCGHLIISSKWQSSNNSRIMLIVKPISSS